MTDDFTPFSKIPRLSREIIITEKLDGTNAQVFIQGDTIRAGSRNRWITPEEDNYGFARWAQDHKDELLTLGDGRHFGEWWGLGIQRKYNVPEKRWSLFNVARHGLTRPPCCHVVPVLYQGEFDTAKINSVIVQLKTAGSVASPGFMNPEGIIIFHTVSGYLFKKTVIDDEKHKGE